MRKLTKGSSPLSGTKKKESKVEKYKFAGKTVILKSPDKDFNGKEFRVEDYWMNVYGKSWMDSNGNPAAINYGFRCGVRGFPLNDKVVYGKIGAFGYLVHESEIEGEVSS